MKPRLSALQWDRLASIALVALVGLCQAGAAMARDDSDKDKRHLFNTFYLDGPNVTWVLTLRENRSYVLTAPDGKQHSGNYRASSDAIAFKSIEKGFLRHFGFKFDRANVRFVPTKKDQPTPGHVLGELPPTKKGERAKWISRKIWQGPMIN